MTEEYFWLPVRAARQLISRLTRVRDPAAEGGALPLEDASSDLLRLPTGDGCHEISVSQVPALDVRLTFTGEVRPKPLGRRVVQETLGVGEPDSEVARVAGVLQHSLQGEVIRVPGTAVGPVLDPGR